MIDDESFAAAVSKLKAAGLDDPKGEARKLYGLAFPRRYVDEPEISDGSALERFRGYIERRANREPYAHICGFRHFWKYVFAVTPDVLDPRPDTETLVELALQYPFERVLDLGTGSGCIIVSLLTDRQEAHGVGTDVSEKALEVARKNAGEVERVHGPDVTQRLTLIASDWFKNVEGRFDLIVSNPPYISAHEMAEVSPEVRNFEPHGALTDDGDGLTHYRTIAAGALEHLSDQGRILVEIGPTQARAVSALFKEAGLENITIHPDLDGRDRVVSARKTA
ncbi:MAG: peptide chain release factor N(5)-glutamine methyltransferase [Paracoccaceae bacterium]